MVRGTWYVAAGTWYVAAGAWWCVAGDAWRVVRGGWCVARQLGERRLVGEVVVAVGRVQRAVLVVAEDRRRQRIEGEHVGDLLSVHVLDHVAVTTGKTVRMLRLLMMMMTRRRRRRRRRHAIHMCCVCVCVWPRHHPTTKL